VKSVEIGGKTIEFDTGKYAKQSGGAVICSCGDSRVLVTSVVGEDERPFDFLPLTVMYQDRNGAYGTIPGSYFKREGRSDERETLISRMIDRPIRPLFPKHFRREMQVVATVMSFDSDNETDVLSMCGASAALHISDAPLAQPVAGVRVCEIDGELVLNPPFSDWEDATINLVFGGTAEAITMVEGECQEAQEDRVLDALELAHEAIKKIVATIEELRAEVGVPKLEVEPAEEPDPKLAEAVAAIAPDAIRVAAAVEGKHERAAAMKTARNRAIEGLLEGVDDPDQERAIVTHAKNLWRQHERTSMRQAVLQTGKRIDGRATNEIRPIWIEVGVAPRAHGSAIFTRGETQAFVTLALGTDLDVQRLEIPTGRAERRFMLTYYFPPYCTGEAYPIRGPKRREVGHGALARRALVPVLPTNEDFPYVMRSTSEILESNGSSSMATVCGTTLALMDAGVPIRKPVAGIAMGLVKEGADYAVLSDILGDEDHLGDMDFKVTGTREGITAFQMDTKIAGVSREVMKQAMEQAKAGRIHILDEMAKAIAAPRAELSPYAPRITTIHIKPDKIREIIGPGGKVIRGIQDTCDVKINVDDSGRVDIASTSSDNTEKALAMIREITQEAEIGALYVGVVKRIVDFGAFVEIFPGTDGLIHISHLAHERVGKVTDVLHEGDEVLVRVIDVDRAGKIRLSRKEALDAGA